jgi:hypothetical protein
MSAVIDAPPLAKDKPALNPPSRIGCINEEQAEAILAATRRGLAVDLWATTLRRITVSREFWDAVERELPILSERKGYRELFWYLLFSSWKDEDTRRLLLPHDLLSSFEERRPHHSRTEAFLIGFREDVILPLGGSFNGAAMIQAGTSAGRSPD